MDRHSDGHHVVDIQLGCTNGARTADAMRSGSDLIVPALWPPPASKEGNVGEYWYHGDTATYFHDELQDKEDACKKTRPRYALWVFWFVILYRGGIVLGIVLGSSFVSAIKGGKALKVLGFALGMFIPVSLVSFLWCHFVCSTEDDDC